MQAAVGAIETVDRRVFRPEADSEREIIERAISGPGVGRPREVDPAAFGVLYERYVERIYRFVYSRVGERCLAEDITAEVFLNALKGIPNYRHTGACFSAWLYRIACNAIVSHYRRVKSELDLDTVTNLADRTDSVLDEVVRRDRSRRIWEAIDRLPQKQREAMRLKFSADLSIEDVGRVLGKSSAAVKLLVYRAVHRLRCELVTLEG